MFGVFCFGPVSVIVVVLSSCKPLSYCFAPSVLSCKPPPPLVLCGPLSRRCRGPSVDVTPRSDCAITTVSVASVTAGTTSYTASAAFSVASVPMLPVLL